MSTTQPAVGDALAGYVLEALVGRGGMGEVFRAHDSRLDRTIALKVLGPHLAGSERFRERFLRESMMAARLDHPNVIPIFEAGESDGALFIAMRLVEGTDLRAILREEGVLDPARAIALLSPVAGALDAAHAAGLVHHDVKPANILVACAPGADPPEHVYLSDFGLTTLSADAGEAGPFTGTADYAAPELVTKGAVDHRVDVYALGCVLFECLTGLPPYDGDSVMAVLWGHVNDPVPAASERNPALAADADSVLRRALAKEPKARYSSCRELVADLRGALGVESPGATRRSTRSRLALALAGVAIAAGTAAAAVLLTRGSSASAPVSQSGQLIRIDPATGSTGAGISVGESPAAVAAAGNAVWVASPGDGSLWRVNPASGVRTRVPAIGVPSDIGIKGNAVYVTSEGPQSFSGSVTAYEAGSGARLGNLQLLACSMTAGAEGVWVAGCPNVQRISESAPFHVVQRVAVPFASPRSTANDRQELNAMATGGGFVYALGDAADQRLWRIDPRSGQIVQTYRLSFAPVDLAADGGGAIWVVDQIGDAVVRIDRESGRQTARIAVPAGASSVALGAGSVWVSSFLDRSVSRIDPSTSKVTDTIALDESPRDIAYGAGAVWAVGDAG